MTTTTAGPVSPPAVRLRRPGWRDPRLLLGIGLIAGAVALGGYAVQAAGRTVPVLATRSTLVAGDAVTAEDLVVREVRLGEAAGRYLPVDAATEGLVALRTVGAGELVPVDAVAPDAELAVRSVAVRPQGELSSAVVEGAVVDLWYVTDGDAADARPLVAGVTVAEVGDERSALTTSAPTVHVLVPTEELPAVLVALAGEGSVQVVPVAGARG